MKNFKKWLISVILSFTTFVVIYLFQAITTKSGFHIEWDHLPPLIFPLILSLAVLCLVFRFLLAIFSKEARARSKKLVEDNKNGEGVQFRVISGLPNMKPGDNVRLYFEDNTLLIKAITGNQTARLPYIQVTDAHIYTQTDIRREYRSPGRRAFWGAVFGGEIGAIVGGFSGTQIKEKIEESRFLMILYTSDNKEKRLVFNADVSYIGRDKAVERLREKAGLPVEKGPMDPYGEMGRDQPTADQDITL